MAPLSSHQDLNFPKPDAQPVDVVRIAAALISAAVIIAALYYGQDVLIPLVCAFLISFALNPPVAWLSRRGLPRIVSVIAVMIVIVAVLASMVAVLGSQLRALSQELPTYEYTIRMKLADLRARLKTPGIFEGALKTVETVQKEVRPENPPPSAGVTGPQNDPQRVQIVPTLKDPFETGIAWLQISLGPMAKAGIVFVFVFLVLLDRSDMRDRLLRMLGGNLHRSTDAIEEAGKRMSKYLLMQLIVNVTYGVPMALGLYLIGVPGALLWGTVAAVMRFVPYVGPMLSAIFPISLAFAVDPGWNMVLWTVALIVVLELISNNIVEPLLYGTSTGLSAMSLIASATFWTALWGPVGLILATPLTVCLLVIGRNIPQLQFLDTLLGSLPALDLPTRIYQRLLADDAEEAIDIATTQIDGSSLRHFYNDVALDVFRLASDDHLRNATTEHRLRVATGMDALLDELREQYPAAIAKHAKPTVVCIGGKWEVDTLVSEMLCDVLALDGISAVYRPATTVSAASVAKLDLDGAETVCVSYFTSSPASPARHFCRCLRRRWPKLRIVLALWNAPPDLLVGDAHEALGADEVVTSIEEASRRIHRIVAPGEAVEAQKAEIPDNEDERVAALHATGVLKGAAREDLDAAASRAADVFHAGFAVISAIDKDQEFILGQSKQLAGPLTWDGTDMIVIPRSDAVCDHVVAQGEPLVVEDAERDPRFAENPTIKLWNARFYAGVPLRTADGMVLGALCILGAEPRILDDGEIEILEAMATDVVAIITGDEVEAVTPKPPNDSSATIGQPVPD
jgi:predicted PurR-regulated permease PerM/GAF domain-containing protein